MTVFKNLILEIQDNIAIVQMNRPKEMNALNNDLLDEFVVASDVLNQSPDVKGLIITGAGKAFVATTTYRFRV